MKKTILLCMVAVLMLVLLTSCSTGVSQEQYDKTSKDLAAAQTQIQSLQGNLTALQGNLTQAQAQYQSLQTEKEGLEEKGAEALAYAEFFDVLMYPSWQELDITPRFDFPSEVEWLADLHSRANALGDTTLSAYLQELENGNENATANLMDYCLERVEEALK
jgi:hypothetical protein